MTKKTRSTSFATLVVAMAAVCPVAQGQSTELEPLPLHDMQSFHSDAASWHLVGDAWTRWDSTALVVEPGTGVLVNQPSGGEAGHLFTTWEHGDLDLELEFMLPQGANSGVYLQGRYEVQLFDSWGVVRPRYSDAGGVYRRYDPAREPAEFEGHAPRVNASRAPGLWQQLRIVFRAPRFDAEGRKLENARFVEVVLNGVTVQQDVEVTGPTRAAAFETEAPRGPLMLQGNLGSVAFRNIRFRHFEPVPPVRLTDARYALYSGEFSSLDEMAAAEPTQRGESYGYVWDLFGTYADRLGSVWEGTLDVPVTGTYAFSMQFNWIDEIPYNEDAVPGHGRIVIDGDTVVEHLGGVPSVSGTAELEAGPHTFQLSYFKNRQQWRPIVFLEVQGPDMPPQFLNAPRSLPEPEEEAPVVLAEVGDEPYVLRSFAHFEGEKRVNVVSVGDPARVHYMLDLESGGLLYAWKHAFVDVGGMWDSRGFEQAARPMGQKLVGSSAPSVARLTDPAAPWPASYSDEAFELLGYTLGEDGRPTFRYRLDGLEVSEHLAPSEDGRSLNRTIRAAGPATDNLWLRVSSGGIVEAIGPDAFRVDGRFFLQTDGRARVRRTAEGDELLIPLASNGGEAAATYTMIW